MGGGSFKPKIPTSIAEIRALLEEQFPQYTYHVNDGVVKVTESTFKGVRIAVTLGKVRVNPKPTTFIGEIADDVCFGILGMVTCSDLAATFRAFLEDRLT